MERVGILLEKLAAMSWMSKQLADWLPDRVTSRKEDNFMFF